MGHTGGAGGGGGSRRGRAADRALAQEPVERARPEGVELVGPAGLLTGLTKTVLETALDEHLAYAKRAPEGRDRGTGRVRRRGVEGHDLAGSPTRSSRNSPGGSRGRSSRCTRSFFIDAIQVKIRDGKIANRPVHTVVDVTVAGDGRSDLLAPADP